MRSQPEHIRHMLMWLCVVIVFSLIGFVWFKSTQTKFVAMLHPEEVKELQRKLAQDQVAPSSILATITLSFNLLRASLGELVGGHSTDFQSVDQPDPVLENNNGGKNLLPLSGDR